MDLLRLILLNTNPGLTAVFSLLIGILLVLSVTGAVRETDETTALEVFLVWLRRAIIILLLVSLPAFILGLYVYSYAIYGYDWGRANQFMDMWFGEFKAAISELWWSLLVVLVMPMFVRAVMLRFIRPALSNWARKFRVKQSGDALSDIRVEIGKIKAKDFDPRSYYKDGYMFLGMDENGQPIYMEDEVFRKNHKKVLGPSQTGKGVLLGVLIDQAIKKGWGVWFVDQKPDDFIYDIMREACELYGREEPTIVDLNGVGPGSYAPFVFGTKRERRERVVKAFGMADTGTNADFFKRNERAVMDYLMPLWDGTLSHLEKLIRGKHPEIDDVKRQWIRANCGGIESNVSEFMQLDTLRATEEESFNVSDALTKGDVVYIRSHMKDTIVRKGCIAMLDELVQVALRKPLPAPVFLVLDECRFVVSDTLADALATVLSKGINMALAYQSVLDLLNLPDQSLNAESIKVGIETNTQVTLSYRANDFDTAEWVSNQTGEAQRTVSKLEKVDVNKGGAEVWGDERSVGQEGENLITTNQLLALPPRVCALIRPNTLSTLLYTSWINIKEVKGIPDRNAKINLTASKPAAAATTAPAVADIETDPFAAQATIEDAQEDPFSAMNEPAPQPDPFAEIEAIDDEADPFAQSSQTEVEHDFSELEDAEADPFAAPVEPKPAAKAKGELSAEEQEAIKQAMSGILASPANKPKRSVDLSSIDNIEGI